MFTSDIHSELFVCTFNHFIGTIISGVANVDSGVTREEVICYQLEFGK